MPTSEEEVRTSEEGGADVGGGGADVGGAILSACARSLFVFCYFSDEFADVFQVVQWYRESLLHTLQVSSSMSVILTRKMNRMMGDGGVFANARYVCNRYDV